MFLGWIKRSCQVTDPKPLMFVEVIARMFTQRWNLLMMHFLDCITLLSNIQTYLCTYIIFFFSGEFWLIQNVAGLVIQPGLVIVFF
jgi:hypothetical protein